MVWKSSASVKHSGRSSSAHVAALLRFPAVMRQTTNRVRGGGIFQRGHLSNIPYTRRRRPHVRRAVPGGISSHATATTGVVWTWLQRVWTWLQR
eukprot:1320734-Pyramimonas_sp.AAC.1